MHPISSKDSNWCLSIDETQQQGSWCTTFPLGSADVMLEFSYFDPKRKKKQQKKLMSFISVLCLAGLCLFYFRENSLSMGVYIFVTIVGFTKVYKRTRWLFFLSLCEHKQPGCHAYSQHWCNIMKKSFL